MTDNHLIIGNKRYSSWSLRGWLALKLAGIPFRETLVPLMTPTMSKDITKFGNYPAKVPTLLKDDFPIWDSQAIMEYAAEQAPEKKLMPTDLLARARARSVIAEMHAGFPSLRSDLPMDLSVENGERAYSENTQNDIERILTIWRECRENFGDGGPFLFGHITMADVAYAPVVARFRSYSIPVDEVSQAYMDAVWNLPEFKEWQQDASKETWVINV